MPSPDQRTPLRMTKLYLLFGGHDCVSMVILVYNGHNGERSRSVCLHSEPLYRKYVFSPEAVTNYMVCLNLREYPMLKFVVVHLLCPLRQYIGQFLHCFALFTVYIAWWQYYKNTFIPQTFCLFVMCNILEVFSLFKKYIYCIFILHFIISFHLKYMCTTLALQELSLFT